jgi:putative addiction module component (TIGR02574 family)
MSHDISMDDLRRLSPAERILLAEELWDSVACDPEQVPITDAQQRELERRLAAEEADPGAGDDWEAVKKRLRRP